MGSVSSSENTMVENSKIIWTRIPRITGVPADILIEQFSPEFTGVRGETNYVTYHDIVQIDDKLYEAFSCGCPVKKNQKHANPLNCVLGEKFRNATYSINRSPFTNCITHPCGCEKDKDSTHVAEKCLKHEIAEVKIQPGLDADIYGDACIVCLKYRADTCLLPCTHVLLCSICASAVLPFQKSHCPQCRKIVTQCVTIDTCNFRPVAEMLVDMEENKISQ